MDTWICPKILNSSFSMAFGAWAVLLVIQCLFWRWFLPHRLVDWSGLCPPTFSLQYLELRSQNQTSSTVIPNLINTDNTNTTHLQMFIRFGTTVDTIILVYYRSQMGRSLVLLMRLLISNWDINPKYHDQFLGLK